jgi:hypothetical protein
VYGYGSSPWPDGVQNIRVIYSGGFVKSDGTAATPYDSLSFKLAGSPALPASVEAMRVTSAAVLIPKLLRHGTDTTATVATAAITVTQSWHKVKSEDTNPDTLSTINGGTDGDRLILQWHTEAITVDEAGNIIVPGSSVALDGTADMLELIYDAALTKWVALSFSDNN